MRASPSALDLSWNCARSAHRSSRSRGARASPLRGRHESSPPLSVAPVHRHDAGPAEAEVVLQSHLRPLDLAGLGRLASAPGAVGAASTAPCARARASSPGSAGDRRRTIASEDPRTRSSRPRRRLRPGLPSARVDRSTSRNSRRRHACSDDARRSARPSAADVDTSELAAIPFARLVALAPAGGVEWERSPSWDMTESLSSSSRQPDQSANTLLQVQYAFLELPKLPESKPTTGASQWAWLFVHAPSLTAIPADLPPGPFRAALEGGLALARGCAIRDTR